MSTISKDWLSTSNALHAELVKIQNNLDNLSQDLLSVGLDVVGIRAAMLADQLEQIADRYYDLTGNILHERCREAQLSTALMLEGILTGLEVAESKKKKPPKVSQK